MPDSAPDSTAVAANPATLSEDDLAALARRFVETFPHFAPVHAQVALALYRLLAQGSPVSWRALAKFMDMPEDALRGQVAGWPGLYEEERGITGFGGLSIRVVSGHRMQVGGRTLFARCAWDTLFLPRMIGAAAEVHSICAVAGTPVRLRVTPRAVDRLDPPGVRVALLPPEPGMAKDLTQNF